MVRRLLRRHLLMQGLCLLAFALRVIGLDMQSLWRDEVDAIRFASGPLTDLVQSFVTPGQNGPFYFLLLKPWLVVTDESEFALRFLSLFFGVLAVPLVYRVARRLFPSLPTVGLVAALLTATSPYLVWYGQEGKMYTLALFLVLLSMDRWLAAIERGGWQRWLGYVIVTGLAFYVHLVAVLIIPAQAAAFLFLERTQRALRWRPWLISLAALLLPYLPLLAWQLPLMLQPADTGFRFVPLHQMMLSMLESYSLGIVPPAQRWLVALFVAVLLAVGLGGARSEARRSSLGVLVCWLLVPIALLFLVTLVRPLFTARYLVFVLPAFFLLLALGLVFLARRVPLLAGLLLAGILVLNGVGLWRQTRAPIKADFREATGYITMYWGPDDLLLFQMPYGRHSFDYYLQRQMVEVQQDTHPGDFEAGRFRVFVPLILSPPKPPYRWAEGLYTNAGMELGDVDRRMARMVQGTGVVWLVATETWMWDERGLVQSWLNENATLTDQAQFARVAVYRYELP